MDSQFLRSEKPVTTAPIVRWAELRPDQFLERQRACPLVYLPIGLCEPHGHIAALGLDTLKADYYCDEAARRRGGIVAPTQGYHIHETGFHAPWLEEVVGEANPLLGGIPPHVMCHLFLYQLRAFANAGFRGVIAVSGHSGGSQDDLRRVARAFSAAFGLAVTVRTDPEWVQGRYVGDHAGRYEISQLMAIRRDCVDTALLHRQHEPGSGGRLALGDDAALASVEFGHEINEAIIQAIVAHADELLGLPPSPAVRRISYEETETLWRGLLSDINEWRSVSPFSTQKPVSASSQWKPFERTAALLSHQSLRDPSVSKGSTKEPPPPS